MPRSVTVRRLTIWSIWRRLGQAPGRELSNAVVAAAAELSALLHEPAPQPERADASGA
jgi:hypothetical protein